MPLNLKALIDDFWKSNVNNVANVTYNEFGLQFELGIFLRNHPCIKNKYRVEFERNVSFFTAPTFDFVKKEIDIVIYDANKAEKYAIELKCPKNGQYPMQMYEFINDILFVQQLKIYGGFTDTCCLTVVDNHGFYQGSPVGRTPQATLLYNVFRKTFSIDVSTVYSIPIGKYRGKREINLLGNSKIQWLNVGKSNVKYYIAQ